MKIRSESNLERVWEHADGTVWYENKATGAWSQLDGPDRARPPRRVRAVVRRVAPYAAGTVAGILTMLLINVGS